MIYYFEHIYYAKSNYKEFAFFGSCGTNTYVVQNFNPSPHLSLFNLGTYAKDSTTNYFIYREALNVNAIRYYRLLIFRVHYDPNHTSCP